MTMNLQQLEYLVAVDQFKSFSRAAEYCNVTQATLSAMIKKLEKELGLVLFDRKTQPIVTTDCGLEIIQEAKKVLHHSHQLIDLASSVKDQVSGRLRIGIIPTIASTLLPIILKPLVAKYPRLQLEVIELTTANALQLLKEGSIDVGIVATPLTDKTIEEAILFYEMLLIYGSEPTSKEYISPEEVRQHKIWLLEEGHCLRDQFLQICSVRPKQDTPDNLYFQPNSFETLLNIVDEFGGLTMIPELYYDRLPAARQTHVSFFQAPIPVREVSLVYFRPFAKLRLINMLTSEIQTLMRGRLRTEQYKNNQLVIAKPE